jgi:hypothetical protein
MSIPIVADIPEFKDGASGRTPLDALTMNKIRNALRQVVAAVNESGGLVPAELRTIFFDDFSTTVAEMQDANPPIGISYQATQAGRYEINGTSGVLQVKASPAPAVDLSAPVYAMVDSTTGTDQVLSFILRARTNAQSPVSTRLGLGVHAGKPDGIFMDVTGFTGGSTVRLYGIANGVESILAVFDSNVLLPDTGNQNVIGGIAITGEEVVATLNKVTVRVPVPEDLLRAIDGYNASSFVSTDNLFRLDNWTHSGRVPITTGVANEQLAAFISEPGPTQSALIALIASQITISQPGSITQRADGRPVFTPEGA